MSRLPPAVPSHKKHENTNDSHPYLAWRRDVRVILLLLKILHSGLRLKLSMILFFILGETRKRKSPGKAGFRKETEHTATVAEHRMIVKCATSVGILYGPGVTGTVFRVGRDMVMTAFHLVEKIVGKLIPQS